MLRQAFLGVSTPRAVSEGLPGHPAEGREPHPVGNRALGEGSS